MAKTNDKKYTYKESQKIYSRYPDRRAIIVNKEKRCKDLPDLNKFKYLVPKDFTIGQFLFIIRKKITLRPEKAIFLFINDILPPISATVEEMFVKYASDNGFLYITYSSENTFG